ncbi:hypothetical protein JCM10207_004746 [Rhodosporidiobolus poonsookiae]
MTYGDPEAPVDGDRPATLHESASLILPIILGACFSQVLYGVYLVMHFRYIADKYYTRISRGVKAVIWGVFVILLVHIALCFAECITWTISTDRTLNRLYNGYQFEAYMPLVAGLAAAPVQTLLMVRATALMQNRRFKVLFFSLSSLIILGAFTACVVNFSSSIISTHNQSLAFANFNDLLLAWLLCSSVVDLLVSISLAASLKTRLAGFNSQTDGLIRRLAANALATAAYTAILAAAGCTLSGVFRNSTLDYTIAYAVWMPLPCCYGISLYTTLSSRRTVEEFLGTPLPLPGSGSQAGGGRKLVAELPAPAARRTHVLERGGGAADGELLAVEEGESEKMALSGGRMGNAGVSWGQVRPPRVRSDPESLQPLNLPRLSASVVPSRTGSVLSRNLILKADFRFVPPPSPSSSSDPSAGAAAGPALNLSGASNLRDGGLGVWGVAQPTETGIRSVLGVLRARSPRVKGQEEVEGREVAWFSTREEPVLYIGGAPYVLREAAHPTRTYSISDRAENLEEIEARLKQDVLRESTRYGGMVLVHSELPSSSSPSNTTLQPTWISTDSVLTLRELFTSLRTPSSPTSASYNVRYFRTPVARDQSPNDGYLDVYTSLLAKIPTSTALVFNCGAGVVRSTFAMSVALIVRRKQLIDEGGLDPYGLLFAPGSPPLEAKHARSGSIAGELVGANKGAMRILQAQSEQAARDRSLLRLMHVLAKCLPQRSQGMILALLSTQGGLLENLRSALLGNFDIILSLLSCLDDGQAVKKVVDAVADHCDAMVNIRESILQSRVRYATLALSDSASAIKHRTTALAALERYFFLIAFAAFVSESSSHFTTPFSAWLRKRTEIAKMISRLRKNAAIAAGHGRMTGTAGGGAFSDFFVFSPVHDLSVIAKGETGELSLEMMGRAGASGEGVVGDEWVQQIIRNRSGIILRPGTILKNDQWLTLAEGQSEGVIRGAINFRRVPGTLLYGLSQPTEEGIRRVLETVKADLKPSAKIVWVGVREEPLVNINGTPYVLRNHQISLRNVKSYSGISSTRLELLESRLKSDVLTELQTFEGRVLVANEADDGSVNPVWETVAEDEEGAETQVKTLREAMDAVGGEVCGESFQFIRVPITAEASPDFHDLKDIIETVSQLDPNESAIVVNDQLGRGRTTRTLVIIKILQDWLSNGGKITAPRSTRPSYTIINNLLRVVRNGFEVKNAVDAAITACGEPFDLLDSIENARQEAEDAEDDTARDKWVAKGVRELRAYFFLILFMAFLAESKPSTRDELGRTSSYEDFVRSRPVFRTIEHELDSASLDVLLPLSPNTSSSNHTGTATNDEVADFVAQRNGRILSAYTLLKSDFFSGLQKMSLPERVEGTPNFRRVPLAINAVGALSAAGDGSRTPASASSASIPSTGATTTAGPKDAGALVYGSGMPTVDGLRRMFDRIGAKEDKVVWSSMREEPVLYVGGRPHVLRLFDRPLENVVTTGVTTATVEAMEISLKEDLRRERQKTGGKVLLHDEIEHEEGRFEVTAMWEEVGENDILTPREVFAMMQTEGYKVDYDRLPVTDEQAPIPGIFSRIEQRVSNALVHHGGKAEEREKVSFGWNCQMGRGRTTTGMVACALVHRILFSAPTGQHNPDLAASFLVPAPGETEPEPHSLHWDGRETEPYLDGEYKIVLQLVGVLGQGKAAKRLVDTAIDEMSGVQNLRTAIYQFKLRVEAADEGSKKREKIFDQALNYLYRYATLIVFANFLLDKASFLASAADSDDEGDAVSATSSTFPSFEGYLRERTEIRKILSRRTLE